MLLRYWHTIRYLRPVQIYGRLWFRLYRPRPDTRPAPAVRTPACTWRACRRPSRQLGPNSFEFIGQTHEITDAADWNRGDWPKLWLYNLHYFDDLVADRADQRAEWHRKLISRWIKENPPADGNGWEPYPISLRLVNWCKWLLAGNEPVEGMLDSMAVQTRYLSKRLERHLLGNHLWANLKTLIFAGMFFQGAEANRWRARGLKLLAREIDEQVLADGGHFERSPMYHAIVLEDLLDLIQLDEVFPGVLPAENVKMWRDSADRMLAWLQAMTHPDGGISFFNDAALGIAPDFEALNRYATEIVLNWQPQQLKAGVLLKPSGYGRLAAEPSLVIADVGPIGPDYLPGHAHADTLSFELSLGNQRIIVNSGIDRYEPGPERLRQRSTQSNSTVEVDGSDSSEVWSSFRVARRARPIGRELRIDSDAVRLTCGHDGYRRLPGKVTHKRSWTLSKDRLQVQDQLSGQFRQAIARFHLHPDVSAEQVDEKLVLAAGDQKIFVSLEGGTARVVDSNYHPRFGESVPTRCIEITFAGRELVSEFRFIGGW